MSAAPWSLDLQVPDEAAQVALGAALAHCLEGGLSIHLVGELGVGKTTLCRGLVCALGHEGPVKSPTYTLVETYALDAMLIHHFDLYRLGAAAELEDMGLRDYFSAGALILVEWPEHGASVLPPADLHITIAYAGAGRRISLAALTESGRSALERLRALCSSAGMQMGV
jgi:tRNA threonylcarbamoyladenosine biosynthesis protein TsaE